MNNVTLDKLRQKLVSLREKTLGEIRSLEQGSLSTSPKEQSGDLSGYSIHLADAASDTYDREFNLNLVSREQSTLNDIDSALAKIENGEYGSCEQCDQPIGESRLNAVPYARFCLHCKEHEEKSQAHQ
ncbi:MAG: TraR/DksA C4-type zinc finger protein [Candidatus Aureabacteria bacterium]|nr:TraR/DksA C4-type zinc finger protein [Candidatus Auribacterota bacterium]